MKSVNVQKLMAAKSAWLPGNNIAHDKGLCPAWARFPAEGKPCLCINCSTVNRKLPPFLLHKFPVSPLKWLKINDPADFVSTRMPLGGCCVSMVNVENDYREGARSRSFHLASSKKNVL